MALPAMHALAELGDLAIYAPRWGRELYRDVRAEVRPTGTMAGEVAVLFPPSLRAAWQARRCARRIGTPTDFRGRLLTDRVPWSPRRAELYAALAARAGAAVDGEPTFAVRDGDSAAEVPDGHVALVPLTGAGSVTQWDGFGELAAHLDDVVFYAGPGEDVSAIAGAHRQVVGQPLSELAATLKRCAVLVTNDSGLMHFGRAVGVPVVTIFGSTVPEWTGAPGVVAVEGPRLPCRPCYSGTCRIGDRPCFDVPVSAVLAAVRRVVDG